MFNRRPVGGLDASAGLDAIRSQPVEKLRADFMDALIVLVPECLKRPLFVVRTDCLAFLYQTAYLDMRKSPKQKRSQQVNQVFIFGVFEQEPQQIQRCLWFENRVGG